MDVCNISREHGLSYGFRRGLEYCHTLHFDDLRGEDWITLIKEALHDAAEYISSRLVHQQREDKFWIHVAQQCLYYGILYCPMQGAAAGHAVTCPSITSDELVRCWVAEDLLSPRTTITGTRQMATGRNYRYALEAGKVLIQALQKYSLLPNQLSNTSSREEVSSGWSDAVTGVSVLAMGVPRLKEEVLFYHDKIGRLRWLSFMNGDGRHVSWDWRENWGEHFKKLIPGERTSTLILRGCSKISAFNLVLIEC
jgi:hypothetical protein